MKRENFRISAKGVSWEGSGDTFQSAVCCLLAWACIDCELCAYVGSFMLLVLLMQMPKQDKLRPSEVPFCFNSLTQCCWACQKRQTPVELSAGKGLVQASVAIAKSYPPC